MPEVLCPDNLSKDHRNQKTQDLDTNGIMSALKALPNPHKSALPLLLTMFSAVSLGLLRVSVPKACVFTLNLPISGSH